MPRTRIRYNHRTGEKYEIPDDYTDPQQAGGFMPDITEFVSPVDMTVISSRSSLREHEKRHGVRQCGELNKVSDYDNDPAPRHEQNYRQNPLKVDVDFQWTE